MSEQADTLERCAVCQGTKSEHVGRQHAFTLVPGQLQTQREVDEQKKKPAQAMPGTVVVGQPPHRDTADRLVMLLMDKGIITQDDALYVLLGRRST